MVGASLAQVERAGVRLMLVPRVSPPTGNVRHLGKIREGKISGEVFCRDPERRFELGLPSIEVDPWIVIEELGSSAKPKKKGKKK